MAVPAQFLKFKGLLQFFDEMAGTMGYSLDDIREQAPHYFTAIRAKIADAEESYRNDNARDIDVKIRASKGLYLTAVKYIEKIKTRK